MADDHLSIKAGELQAFLKSAPKSLDKNKVKALMRAASLLEGAVGRQVKTSVKNGTGNLSRSFNATLLSARGRKTSAGILSDVVYAEVRNRPKTTIRPKRKQYLAIPISSEAKQSDQWPRDARWKGRLFAYRSRKGNLLLGERVRGEERPINHFVLKRQVKQTGTQYIEKAWQASSERVGEILGEQAVDALMES